MKHEKSCGAVVYKIDNNLLKFLITKHANGGHWSFPKGHVEAGETEVMTATREILEETGLKVEIDTNFRKVVSYNVAANILKHVCFFTAMPTKDSNVVSIQEEEVSRFAWLDFEKAYRTLTFNVDKNVLKCALEYLKSAIV